MGQGRGGCGSGRSRIAGGGGSRIPGCTRREGLGGGRFGGKHVEEESSPRWALCRVGVNRWELGAGEVG